MALSIADILKLHEAGIDEETISRINQQTEAPAPAPAPASGVTKVEVEEEHKETAEEILSSLINS